MEPQQRSTHATSFRGRCHRRLRECSALVTLDVTGYLLVPLSPTGSAIGRRLPAGGSDSGIGRIIAGRIFEVIEVEDQFAGFD